MQSTMPGSSLWSGVPNSGGSGCPSATRAHAEPMQNPAAYERLLPNLERFDVVFGALTLNHSRFDRSVLGSDDDVRRFVLVFATLWPGRDWPGTFGGVLSQGGSYAYCLCHLPAGQPASQSSQRSIFLRLAPRQAFLNRASLSSAASCSRV